MVPLAGLVLPPQRVAWVLCRLLELVVWLHQSGFYHAGPNPESLAQRTAVCLLGDASGNGVRLRATVSERLADFLLTPHHNAYAAFDDYRELLTIAVFLNKTGSMGRIPECWCAKSWAP